MDSHQVERAATSDATGEGSLRPTYAAYVPLFERATISVHDGEGRGRP